MIKQLIAFVFSLALAVAGHCADLHSLPNAIAGITQEWHLERTDGNLLRVTIFSTVDPSEWGTSSYFVAFDYLTGDTFYTNGNYYYWSFPSTDESVVIPSMDEAKAICADWLSDHIAPYAGATEVEWNEIWISDLPDWNSWGWTESIDCTLDWWADWDSVGARFSNSKPSDFGKYLWDGSINPNYAEPLVLKKNRRHRK